MWILQEDEGVALNFSLEQSNHPSVYCKKKKERANLSKKFKIL